MLGANDGEVLYQSEYVQYLIRALSKLKFKIWYMHRRYCRRSEQLQ